MATTGRLLEIMGRLRNPEGGCPWDLRQTYSSLVPYTLEEAYEVADAIERGALDELRDELGDLLFQVVFYARIAEEEGRFQFRDVVEAISDKLVRRHPHVFGDEQVRSADEQTRAWEAHKERERRSKRGGESGALDGVSRALPALVRAQKLQRRAARVGFDWPTSAGVIDKIREECSELEAEARADAPIEAIEDELGDLLFSCVNLARHFDVDAESALRRASAKFERRFVQMEHDVGRSGRTLEEASAEELDAAWERVKTGEGDPPRG